MRTDFVYGDAGRSDLDCGPDRAAHRNGALASRAIGAWIDKVLAVTDDVGELHEIGAEIAAFC